MLYSRWEEQLASELRAPNDLRRSKSSCGEEQETNASLLGSSGRQGGAVAGGQRDGHGQKQVVVGYRSNEELRWVSVFVFVHWERVEGVAAKS